MITIWKLSHDVSELVDKFASLVARGVAKLSGEGSLAHLKEHPGSLQPDGLSQHSLHAYKFSYMKIFSKYRS